MRKIASFELNHDTLTEGFYVSRQDGDVVTYDMRFKKPNRGDYLSPAVMHTIEHLVASTLRNGEFQNNVVYFGPMGCRTGFYVLLFDMDFDAAKAYVKKSVEEALSLGYVPGNKRVECGNYRSHDLKGALRELKKYLNFLN